MKLSKNAKFVLEKRLLKRDEKGRVTEKPEDMFLRVASAIASVDKIYDEKADIKKTTEIFYRMMVNFDFLPNFPCLRNAGRELGQLAACFVIPVGDSIEEIFEAVKEMALIQRSGGGTGFSFSRLRPQGSRVKTTDGIASGPVSFMEVFDVATGVILEGGTRRGANMGILRVDHPDILKFITCKKEPGKFTNFNLSVALTKKFMEAVEENREYELVDPSSQKSKQKISARKVFNLMAEMAWLNGEPGVIFIDRINEFNPTPALGEIEATNPCGEQPLLPYESCVLGSINLNNFVKNKEIDWENLRQVIRHAVHFLDNVIDKNVYPLPEIEKMSKGNRKIGLGVMGFADLLIKLDIAYDSNEAVDIAQKIMKFIDEESKKSSRELAEFRGVFPNWEKSIYFERKEKIRNAAITTLAPTGTLSLIANTSTSIEPWYAPAYLERVTFSKKPLIIVSPLFEKIAKERGFYSKELVRYVLARGSCRGIKIIPEDVQRIFVSAHEVDIDWHLKIQAAFQRYTDNSISKTVNLPSNATKEDIKKIFMTAYELGLKGLTVYREKSRKEQILSSCPKCKI
jgi:ribonucleoside-diphosphate reductase alpha chain